MSTQSGTQSQVQAKVKFFSFPQTREGANQLSEAAAMHRSKGRLVWHQGVVDGSLQIKVQAYVPKTPHATA